MLHTVNDSSKIEEGRWEGGTKNGSNNREDMKKTKDFDGRVFR